MNRLPYRRSRSAFTLVELLVVVAIIALLITILLPALSMARERAKATHCLARMKDFSNGLAAYEGLFPEQLPVAEWVYGQPNDDLTIRYGWAELLFRYAYQEDCSLLQGKCPPNFPVQRNLDPKRWDNYFVCRSSKQPGPNAGNYRVYLPFWTGGRIERNLDGTYKSCPGPRESAARAGLNPKKPLLGDANEKSCRGDGDPEPDGDSESCVVSNDCCNDCSFIDAGEAPHPDPQKRNNNWFSDRHSGGANYLFADFHATWSDTLRQELLVDWDLNGVAEVPP